jgi:hypothetical protein
LQGLIDGIRPDEDEFAFTSWQDWIPRVIPGYLWGEFADYHVAFWDWVWSIEAGTAASPFVAIWPRGFAKSTSTECAVSLLAAKRARKYALYCSSTQEQADTHVSNIAAVLESQLFATHHKGVSERLVGKYGNSQGWRRNRLRTASGFTVDAIGLDTAARGAKVDEDRPDLLIFDDIDEILDSPGTVTKKITTLTKSLLPARASHAAVLVAQNLITADGIVAQLADRRADFLIGATISGPHPAIVNLTVEQREGRHVITGGTSTWPAKSIDDLQTEMDDIGYSAFMTEKQHDVDLVEGSIFEHVTFQYVKFGDLPTLEDTQVWVDPAVTDTDKSDSHGIQVDARGVDGDMYRLYSWEGRTSPEDSLRRAIRKAIELKASCVGVETDQGGDTWKTVYESVWKAMVDEGEIPADMRMIPFRQAKAGSGHGPKAHRASQMLVDYERGKIKHVEGTHVTLERALKRYLVRKPYDLVDAGYWSWYGLMGGPQPLITSPARITQESVWR